MERLVFVLALTISGALASCRHPKPGQFLSKKQGIPMVVGDNPASNDMGIDKRLVEHLQFNGTKGAVIEDSSGYANNGIMQDGAIVVNFPQSKCGNAAYTYCGDILFHGDTFQAKPREGVTIAAFINLKDVEGSRSIFDTIGISHQCGQFHFEVNYGNVRWFHRNETQHIIFSCTAEGKPVQPNQWAHLAGTYDSATGHSKIYINGELRNMTNGGGLLSRDWMSRAGIGDHKAGRPLMGFIDEFRIYNYALNKVEIEALAKMCLPDAAAGPTSAPTATPPPATATTKKLPFRDQNKDSEFGNRGKGPNNKFKFPQEESVEEAVLKRSSVRGSSSVNVL
ncbi:uncharacterized protein LOC110052917 isoform X3 [Orbicella faveolata]|nr:uncharacterized protein LOC110052917 isoform X3 [Orbicella faveolata]XP_020614769.1 uncharacterized protein LOC110052917 isoform X3 [Orbicella faveolata]